MPIPERLFVTTCASWFAVRLLSLNGSAVVRILSLIVLILASNSVLAQERFLIDWDEAGEEALNHLSELVRIDSTNPPGGETRVAKYVEAVLASEGIDSDFYELEAGRASLVARL
jgi:hypothetical protein